MQAAILAGGKGSRLLPITGYLPKSMVPVNGKPFLQYQLELLRRCDINDVVLCVGHLADQIVSYFGDGRNLGMRIRYSIEKDQLGTGGAIRNALPLLESSFLVMYGDSYLAIDYKCIEAEFHARSVAALMVVFKNEDKYDSSNVVVQDDFVTLYSKKQHPTEMTHIDAGLSIISRASLSNMPVGYPIDLGKLFEHLSECLQLAAYRTSQRFFEIGSLTGLAEFTQLVRRGGLGL